jgi:hypothetical protein
MRLDMQLLNGMRCPRQAESTDTFYLDPVCCWQLELMREKKKEREERVCERREKRVYERRERECERRERERERERETESQYGRIKKGKDIP